MIHKNPESFSQPLFVQLLTTDMVEHTFEEGWNHFSLLFFYSSVPERISFPKEEEKTLSFWEENDCFQTSLKMSEGKPVSWIGV